MRRHEKVFNAMKSSHSDVLNASNATGESQEKKEESLREFYHLLSNKGLFIMHSAHGHVSPIESADSLIDFVSENKHSAHIFRPSRKSKL
jgi:hypothetical protein